VSELIVIGYNDQATATQAYNQVMELTEDKFADAMKPYGGQVLKTSLSAEDEKELAHDLGGDS